MAFSTLGSAYNVADALEASKSITLARAPEPPANILAAGVDVSKRAITHLYVCTDTDSQGRCQNLETTNGNCRKASSGLLGGNEVDN